MGQMGIQKINSWGFPMILLVMFLVASGRQRCSPSIGMILHVKMAAVKVPAPEQAGLATKKHQTWQNEEIQY